MVQDSIETLVANVRPLRFHGQEGEVRSGTKHFVGGALVTFKSGHWGMSAQDVTVIGRHRKSKRLITVGMQRRHLTNWRLKHVCSPTVIARLSDGHYESRTEDDWQATARSFNNDSFVYAFERSEDEVRALAAQWADESKVGTPPRFDASSAAMAIAYRNSPSEPIGLGALASDRTTTIYMQSGLDVGVQKEAKKLLLTKLGIVNRRHGKDLGLRHQLVESNHDGDDPVRVYREIGADGREIRRVEQYRDGRRTPMAGSINLAATPIPSIDAINAGERFSAQELDALHFESVWVGANQ